MKDVPCPTCGGRRLKKESLAVTVGGLNISELCATFGERSWSISIENLKLNKTRGNDRQGNPQGNPLAAGLPQKRGAGISHPRPQGRLAVGRRGAAHPAGHADRLVARSACCISSTSRASACTSATTTSSSTRSSACAIWAIRSSSSSTTRKPCAQADYIVDIGPGAGVHGGEVIVCGTPEELMRCEELR